MQNIIKYIEQCNDICYTSYRTAAKMQILHKELNSKFNIFLFLIISLIYLISNFYHY